jgi:hypothetical protein
MLFQTALPLWTRIVSAAAEVAALTAASIDHAKLAAHAAVSQRRREKEHQQREVLQFEEVGDSGAARVFRTPSLRPNQRIQ